MLIYYQVAITQFFPEGPTSNANLVEKAEYTTNKGTKTKLNISQDQLEVFLDIRNMGCSIDQFKKWNILVWKEGTRMKSDRKVQLEEVLLAVLFNDRRS
jgi:hypothetical protein